MNLTNLTNSIHNAFMDYVNGTSDEFETKTVMANLIASETWPFDSDDCLRVEDLSDEWFRAITMWILTNRNSYSNRYSMIRDMREIFPGLGLSTCERMTR